MASGQDVFLTRLAARPNGVDLRKFLVAELARSFGFAFKNRGAESIGDFRHGLSPRPLPPRPAGTDVLKLEESFVLRPLPCPACTAGCQVSQRCPRFILQNFPFRLGEPTGAASCSVTVSNHKTFARARQAVTRRMLNHRRAKRPAERPEATPFLVSVVEPCDKK